MSPASRLTRLVKLPHKKLLRAASSSRLRGWLSDSGRRVKPHARRRSLTGDSPLAPDLARLPLGPPFSSRKFGVGTIRFSGRDVAPGCRDGQGAWWRPAAEPPGSGLTWAPSPRISRGCRDACRRLRRRGGRRRRRSGRSRCRPPPCGRSPCPHPADRCHGCPQRCRRR